MPCPLSRGLELDQDLGGLRRTAVIFVPRKFLFVYVVKFVSILLDCFWIFRGNEKG